MVERASAAKELARQSKGESLQEAGSSRDAGGEDICPGENDAQHGADKEDVKGKPGPGDQIAADDDAVVAAGGNSSWVAGEHVSKRIRIE